jgi:hypothetical protein
LHETSLRRQKRGGIDNGGRPHGRLNFFFRGCFCRLIQRGGIATRLVTAARVATASWFAARIAARIAAGLLGAAAATENPVEQTDAAPRLAALLGAAGITTASGFAAGIFAAANWFAAGIFAATLRFTAAVASAATEQQVHQRPTTLLLAAVVATARIATTGGLTARIFAAATGITAGIFAAATGIAARIRTAGIATHLLLAAAQEVHQRPPTFLLATGLAAGIAAGIHFAATTGIHVAAWIRIICLTTGRLRAAPVVVHTEHSVEQVGSEALGTQA